MLARSRTVNATTYLFAVVLLLSLFFLSLPYVSPGSGRVLADPGSGWEVQDVILGRPSVAAISAVDADNLWAVGYDLGTTASHGFILKTTDGGEHWEYQGSEDLDILVDVCAVDANTAWAVGGSTPVDPAPIEAIIMKTEDGGRTWNVQKHESGYTLTSVSALNANIALAAGGKITIEGFQIKKSGILLVTVDGGNTWSTLLSSNSDIFQDVALIDMNTAWVLGDQALKTTDGGVTWEVKHTSYSPYLNDKLSVVDADTVWMTRSGIVLRTIDGGGYWDQFKPDSDIHIYNDVAAVDENTAWVTSGNLSMPSLDYVVFKTEDGGGSWESFYMNMPYYTAACAVDADTMWASGMFTMVKTADGGANWEMQGPDTDRDLYSVSAMDADAAIAVGESGTFASAVPEAGGFLAFSGPLFNAPVPNDLRSVSMLAPMTSHFDSGDIWVVGTGGMVIRINESVATPYQEPGTTKDLFDISPVDVSIAWAVGQDVILKTTDGGTTWSTQVDIPLRINGVSAVDDITAWAVADGGIIGKTVDGTAWGVQPSGTVNNLYGVSAVDAFTAWAVGAGGTIVKTTDGGETWIRQDSKTTNTLYDVCAVNADVAWAVGEHATVLKTIDGGGQGIAFNVNSVTPDTAAQFTWATDLQVAGTGFQPGATVRLEKGTVVLAAYSVSVVSGEQVTCTAGFFGAEPGIYDVVVTNPDGQEARLPGAFTVASACGAGSSTALLMLGLTLGLFSLAGSPKLKRRKEQSSG